MKKVFQWLCFSLLCLFSAPLLALKTQETTLKNGLKVIVRPDNRAPVAAVQVWYKVGSAYEHNGITGISHMLEHMMFKGTKKYPAGKLHKMIIEKGGKHNAFTTTDATAYTENIEVNALETILALEADRMANLILNAQAFEKEKQVVIEERRLRVEDVPENTLRERFLATAHVATPYHHPVIGWMSDIQGYTLADLKQWYTTWYAPNNATLVVVGQVDFNEVLKLAEKYFGKLKARNIPKRKSTEALPNLGQRRIKVHFKAQVPEIRLGYNLPILTSVKEPWEVYALFVLQAILTEGESARLNKELIRNQRVASKVQGYYNPYHLYPTLLEIIATPAQTRTLSEVENAIMSELNALKMHLVSDAELNRVKKQLVAQKVYQRDSMTEQALEIGWLETIGLSWQESEKFSAHIARVSPEQVKQVANKYLVPQRLVVGTLIPNAVHKGV